MKVLVVTNMYPTDKMPFYGIFVEEQVKSLRDQGVLVEVFFINGRESRLSYFTSISSLIRTLRSNHYDVIHCHHTYCVYPISIAKRFSKRKIPTILTFHEGEVHKTDRLKAKNIDFIKRLVFSKKIKTMALKMVAYVIAVQKDLINSLAYRGEYTVIPCGVDLELFRPMEREWCRKKLNLPLEGKIVFFPAAPDNANKGIEVLGQTIRCLNRKDIHLVTAGHIPHDEIPIYMCAADVIVQLSDYEASPMALKEAMAVNVPVVFTDVGDARLTVGKARGCFICERNPQDVADKVEKALRCNGSSEGRRRIIETGLGLSDIAREVIRVYHDVTKLKTYKSREVLA